MPIYSMFYVYQLSDFDTSGSNITPPDESGARAAGSPPFDITLSAGASNMQLDVDDNNNVFNEIGGPSNQSLATAITLDGVTYPAGVRVVINYAITTDDGFSMYSITLDAGNTGNNTTTAVVTNGPMVAGQQYTFTSESNIGNGSVPYTQLACFAQGTKLDTPSGGTSVEQLRVGDMVMTVDDGPQPIRWIGKSVVSGRGMHAPILVQADTFGPHGDLLVSPEHRILVSGALSELYFAEHETLVAAKALINHDTVRPAPCETVTYWHIMFDRHQLVWSNGCITESYLGAAQHRHTAADRELGALFGKTLPRADDQAFAARPLIKPFEGLLLQQAA